MVAGKCFWRRPWSRPTVRRKIRDLRAAAGEQLGQLLRHGIGASEAVEFTRTAIVLESDRDSGRGVAPVCAAAGDGGEGARG
jgi:hypothetical protein